jgi:type I restriction enzyme M protein
VPNGNYLWINLFATSLKPAGRAALVMANSASDARHSEADIRRTLIEQNLIYGMLTLPSNLFYTVTLPATLWFFDRAKADERVLFIDARNIFTQVDRAHRELSDEQIQNIAIIPRLHKGRRHEFTALVAATVAAGRQAVAQLQAQWQALDPLAARQAAYFAAHPPCTAASEAATLDAKNAAQRELRAQFEPFFAALHAALKALDKAIRNIDKRRAEAAKAAGRRATGSRQAKAVKDAVQALHDEVKTAERYFDHVAWLQQRFPQAAYEDVTGLCKLATPAEIEEQDWSLNPGRYVGVVIEEDGKTEAEFVAGLTEMSEELDELHSAAAELTEVIRVNIAAIVEAAA